MKRVLWYVSALLLLTVLHSCGYQVLSGRESLEFERLHILPVENRTREPGLEDLLHGALVEELARDRRIRVVGREAAEVTLETSVIRFTLDPTVEAGGIAVRYEIVMDADFRLVRTQTGEVLREISGLGSPIRTSFSVASNALGARASQEAAESAAARSLARELANRVLLR